MPLPTTLPLPVPHTPQNISLPERPPQHHPYSQMSHFPNGLPQNPNFIDTKSPSAPAPGSFVSIPTVKPPKTSLKRLYPAFSEDDDSAPAPVSNGPSSEAQPQPQAEPVKEEVDMTAMISNPSNSTHAMNNTPHFVPASNQLPSPGLSEPKLASKEPSPSPQVEEPSLVTPSPAFDALPTPPTSRPELYSIIGQVGEGTFGKVYKARNTVNNVHVALKRIRMESEKDGFPVTAMREIKLLQSLRHDNVVRLYEMMVSSGV